QISTNDGTLSSSGDDGGNANVSLRPVSRAVGTDESDLHPMHSETGGIAIVAADGTATLGPVEAGSYDLILSVQSDGYWGVECARVAVSLSAGANTASIAMPPLHAVTMLFEDGDTRGNVRVQRVGAPQHEQRHVNLGKDGRVTIRHLLAGEYTVTRWGGKAEGMMTVRVPDSAEVVFAPTPVNAMRVTIADAAGQLARAGFEDGDLIVAIEGAEFEGTRQLQLLFMSNMAKEQCKFAVLRGSERIEVTANMRELERGSQMGDSMEPATR
ncbi:MAG: hypothetical protein L0Z55_10730, partial [Planctomycetes bacterium]|nr:hypothetical protein [Planctomycetota bacterium]